MPDLTDRDAPAAGREFEWWTVVAWTPRGVVRVYFVGRGTAEQYATVVSGDEDAELVVLEHWRGGRRIEAGLVEAPHEG